MNTICVYYCASLFCIGISGWLFLFSIYLQLPRLHNTSKNSVYNWWFRGMKQVSTNTFWQNVESIMITGQKYFHSEYQALFPKLYNKQYLYNLNCLWNSQMRRNSNLPSLQLHNSSSNKHHPISTRKTADDNQKLIKQSK